VFTKQGSKDFQYNEEEFRVEEQRFCVAYMKAFEKTKYRIGIVQKNICL